MRTCARLNESGMIAKVKGHYLPEATASASPEALIELGGKSKNCLTSVHHRAPSTRTNASWAENTTPRLFRNVSGRPLTCFTGQNHCKPILGFLCGVFGQSCGILIRKGIPGPGDRLCGAQRA